MNDPANFLNPIIGCTYFSQTIVFFTKL